MELKDFIKSVIVEISHGVLGAIKELEDKDVLINPTTTKGVITQLGGTERSVQNIEFDISVSLLEETANNQTQDKKGTARISVLEVLSLNIGTKNAETDSSSYKNATINRIKFSVPISLPTDAEPGNVTAKLL